jgi:glutamate-1-semialdehyde 2,1-aminomutase
MSFSYSRSEEVFQRAKQTMFGGDPYGGLGYREPHPIYWERAEGPYIYDVDGNEYVDLMSGFTSLPLGHEVPEVRAALTAQVAKTSYLPHCTAEIADLATALCARVPSLDKVTFTDSASKATINAIRYARAFTGRELFAKFCGAYHGSWDSVQYGSAVRYGGDPEQKVPLPGVSLRSGDDVVLLRFNEPDECERVVADHASELGSLIVEPVEGDGYIAPAPGFLEFLRDICDRYGIVLIFDETITLTLAPGGAQELYGVTPDLTTMGKFIGGGMPIGAMGGREEIMAVNDPDSGRVHVPTGTSMGGHILAAVAGLTQLELMTPEVYARLHGIGEKFRQGVNDIGARLAPNLQATGVGHLCNLHWVSGPVVTHRDHLSCDLGSLVGIDESLLAQGYVSTGLGRTHLNAAMSDDHIDGLLEAIENAVQSLPAAVGAAAVEGAA